MCTMSCINVHNGLMNVQHFIDVDYTNAILFVAVNKPILSH